MYKNNSILLFKKNTNFTGKLIWEFLGLSMQNFQGIIFIWIRTNKKIFKSALVYLYVLHTFTDAKITKLYILLKLTLNSRTTPFIKKEKKGRRKI